MAKKKKIEQPKTLILTDTAEKARTIKKFVGRQYIVMSSNGFLRDLPKTQIGIDEENNFEPKYITVRGKGELLKQLSKESLKARRIYAATNLDPEGEMIAKHYCDLFGINPSSNFRLVLNEITKESIKSAIQSARVIDTKLIDEYEVRRAVNRLFKFKLLPILSAKIYRGISINLMPALILKMICEQEKKLQPLNDLLSDRAAEKFDKPLSLKNLQMLAVKDLNLSIGTVSITIKQLYEGLSIDNIYQGLITFYKGQDIQPSSEMYEPEKLEKFLTPNQLKLYKLIWQHYKNEPTEIIPDSKYSTMTRYNDFLLMCELESKGINWADKFAVSLNSMLKRKYIELTPEGYKPTKLGLEIMKVLKENFSTIINFNTLNKLETQISKVATGKIDKINAIVAFYKQFNNLVKKAIDKFGDDLTPKEPPIIETDEICDKCGRKMVLRHSRYGQFLACSGYPDCKNTKPYFEYVEAKCPKCKGRLTKQPRSKGRSLYICENNPATCDFSTWDEPQNKVCDKCGSTLFVHKFKDRAGMIYCGNEKCDTRKEHPINVIKEHQRRKFEEKIKKK